MVEIQDLAPAPKKYAEISGWLILPAIGVAINPIVLLIRILPGAIAMLSGKLSYYLATGGTGEYNPLWAPVLVFEQAGNFCLFIFSVIVAVYFFLRAKAAPRLVVIYLGSNLVFLNLVFFIAYSIPEIKAAYGQIKLQLILVLIGCLIWIPYFLFSKRVKKTFVR